MTLDGAQVNPGGADESPPTGQRGCASAVVLAGGVVLVILTLSLWNTDMPPPLRAALVAMGALALFLGLAGLIGARR
jgi:hypothetical protein